MVTSDKNMRREDELKIYTKVRPQYGRTKQDVWDHIDRKIDIGHEVAQQTPVFQLILRYAAAALIILLLGVGFMKFHTREVTTAKGEKQVEILPDDSRVQLNALSQISYHPYWWRFDRSVKLNGESFFEVGKGKKFTVKTENIDVTVLGTSFNVYARNRESHVACLSGKVKVNSYKHEVVLGPNQKISVSGNNMSNIKSFNDETEVNSWTRNEFYYRSTALSKVFFDLELQFDVAFDLSSVNNVEQLQYSGYFKKNHSVEKVLNLVCKPFDLRYEKTEKGMYRIFSK